MQTDVYSPGDSDSDGTDILARYPAVALSFPGRTHHVLSTCQGRKDRGPAQCKPTGTAPGFPMPREGCACRKVALPREETEAQSLTASLPMKEMLGSSGAGAHSGAALPLPIPQVASVPGKATG